MNRSAKRGSWSFFLVGGVAVAALFAACGRSAAADAPAPSAAPNDYDVQRRHMQTIRPGTVLTDQAPAGWSNLIIKSQPRIAQGDVNKAPGITVSMARLLSVGIVANVKQVDVDGRPRFMLERVALGLATRIGDRDVVISSDTQAQLGANLGLIARTVLSGSETEMENITQVLRAPTILVFDGPTTVVYNQRHRPMIVRNAVLVDAATGRLFTTVWLVDKDDAGNYTTAVSPMNLLKPNTIEDRQLSVDADQFTFGLPSSTAIALVRIPPGTPMEIPPSLLPAASAAEYTIETAQQLEAGLRELIRDAFRKQLSAQRDAPAPPAQPMPPRVK